MDTPWKQLVYKEPAQLQSAISYLHHAAQLVAMVGNSLLPKQEDDSQSTLQWLPGVNALAGQMIDGKFRAALRYLPFELLVLDDENRIREGEFIPERTKEQLLQWLQKAVTRAGGDGKKIRPITHFEIPDHEVKHGNAFPDFNSAYHNELIHYRANADWILNEVTGLYKDTSPVRTWPHHFDTGAVITVEREADGSPASTIGIGWAIPDDNFDQPYYYVNHWTKAKTLDYDALPELEGSGNWYLKSWKGAALMSSKVVSQHLAADQQQEVLQFFRSAIRATKGMLLG